MWLIVRDAVVMVAAGIVIALPCAWALSRLVEAQLFGVRGVDASTVGLANAVLTLVALGAAMLPAWRAASVSPTEALRFESREQVSSGVRVPTLTTDSSPDQQMELGLE